jgi:hypothetical protein
MTFQLIVNCVAQVRIFGRNLTPEWIGRLPLIEINVPKPSNRSFIRVQQQQQASQSQTNQLKRSASSGLPMQDHDFFWKRKRDLKDIGTQHFYYLYLLGILAEYLISYFGRFVAFSC